MESSQPVEDIFGCVVHDNVRVQFSGHVQNL